MLAKLWIAEPVFQAEAVSRSEYHASTLLALPNNEYLCAWFAGTKEGNPDTAIWLSHRSCGSWLPPEQVAKVAQTAHWNPCTFLRCRKHLLVLQNWSLQRSGGLLDETFP